MQLLNSTAMAAGARPSLARHLATFLLGIALLSAAPAFAQSTATSTAQRSTASATEASAQPKPRPRATQLRVYRRVLAPTALRACESWYEQEYRPSGTVIVPRMRCYWVNG